MEDEISSYPPPDQPDLPLHDPPMNEPQPKKLVKTARRAPATVTTATAKPSTVATAPTVMMEPTARKPTKPRLWTGAVRFATAEYQRLGQSRGGTVTKPGHRKKPLTPSRLAKIISRRPDMPTTRLAEYIGNRYGLSADALRSTHNQILVARTSARRCYRHVHDLVPDDQTVEATTGFYRLGKAVKEAHSSGSAEEFI